MNNDHFEEAYKKYRENAHNPKNNEITGEHIIAVRKNNDGDIIAFKTTNNRELDYLEALQEVKSGTIEGLDIFHKYNRDIIRSEPDGIKENNLDNLPEF